MEEADKIEIARLQRGITGLRMEVALLSVLLRLKAGFRSDQQRVPAGNRDGGQWADEGRGDGNDFRDELPLVNVSHSDDGFPEIPDEPPPTTREKNSVSVGVARFLRAARITLRATMVARWLWEYGRLRIDAYLEPAKTLDELKEAATNPRPGYEVHHIVEQTPARQDGLPDSKIRGYDNKVLVPTYRHWEITAWYARKNNHYGGLSPREFLRGQRWELRYSVGLEALRIHGVLLP